MALVDFAFRILGPTQLRVDGRFGGAPPKLSGMLAVLLLEAGRRLSVNELIKRVWTEDEEWPGKPTVHSYASKLRRLLAVAGIEAELVGGRGDYRLMVPQTEIDFYVFKETRQLAEAALADGDQQGACDLLDSAVSLWQDQPLADLRTRWADAQRARLTTNHYLPTCSALIDCQLALCRFDAALDLLDSLQADDPLNPRLAEQHMRALWGLRRKQDALAYYAGYRRLMLAEVGLEPDAELRALHERLFRDDESKSAVAAHSEPDRSATAVAPVLSQLPPAPPDFVGRYDKLRSLDSLIEGPDGEPRLGVIALVGEAGVGKTALALHWAERVRHRFAGAAFVDLHGFSASRHAGPAEVLTVLLGSLGVPPERIPDPPLLPALLRSLLGDRRFLIVLDNAADSEHVERLLQYLAGCVLLVTSRRRLKHLEIRAGARCVTVTPLCFDHAARLLADRLGARVDREPTAFAGLVRLSSRNPLVLRIIGEYVDANAGARLAEAVRQLSQRGALLDVGDEGAGEGATLREIFGCSLRVLSAAHQRLFRLLGLNPGRDISLGAAAALAGCSREEATRGLNALCAAHLMRRTEGIDRYVFYDLLRDYATECVNRDEVEDERRAALNRLFDWYLYSANNAERAASPHAQGIPLLPLSWPITAEEFSGNDDVVQWCSKERANIVAIVAEAYEQGFTGHAWRLPNTLRELFKSYGFYEEILTALPVALRAARAEGSSEGESGSMNNLGYVHSGLNNHVEAEHWFRAAHDLASRMNWSLGSTTALHNVATERVHLGDYDEGIRLYRQVMEVEREEGGDGGLADTLHRLGWAFRRRKRYDQAATHCQQALLIRERIGDMRGQGATLTELAILHYEIGDLATSAEYCDRAYSVHRGTRDYATAGLVRTVQARIENDLCRFSKAIVHAKVAIRLCQRTRSAITEAIALQSLGDSCCALGRTAEGCRAREEALTIFEAYGDPRAAALAPLLDR
ncbi:AfsR/SARP family transcriptional regulator [Allokutzneria oryzae]|uniref:BTAD domain-containing putative transcriptional regulator n=1 Tax=Allokutzneria oryzae TaxID=1378989 RepID=A0ABV6ABK1_9PSEU